MDIRAFHFKFLKPWLLCHNLAALTEMFTSSLLFITKCSILAILNTKPFPTLCLQLNFSYHYLKIMFKSHATTRFS